ncbi:MAG: histidine kinase [Eggerthellaceae bacterium]|nr:histidine kinase [Eggerthellaceae bacterium]
MFFKVISSRVLEVFLLIIIAIAGAAIFMATVNPIPNSHYIFFIAGISFTVAVVLLFYIRLRPDVVRARQSDLILNIASETLMSLQDGLNMEAAQNVCHFILPGTRASAVSIVDNERILGYAGEGSRVCIPGMPFTTRATREVLNSGEMRILSSKEEIGFANDEINLNAGIVAPLKSGEKVIGALKLYYRKFSDINATQLSLVKGLAVLLSSEIAAAEIDEQRNLAATAELRALQAQINPHFLFNTLNTIASFTRTDSMRAWQLLREFALFYRMTLENSKDMITLKREMEQVERYFMFETARFGEDRLELNVFIEDPLNQFIVPAFLVQPLVENAVKYAMREGECLHINVRAFNEGGATIVEVSDDGAGMDERAKERALATNNTSSGSGIAMSNIASRISALFEEDSHMEVISAQGEGTIVRLVMYGTLEINNL